MEYQPKPRTITAYEFTLDANGQPNPAGDLPFRRVTEKSVHQVGAEWEVFVPPPWPRDMKTPGADEVHWQPVRPGQFIVRLPNGVWAIRSAEWMAENVV